MKNTYIRKFLIVVIFMVGIGGFVLANSTPSLVAGASISEDAAIKRAIGLAQSQGLKNQSPRKVVAKLTTLSEWFDILQFTPGADAKSVGLDPDRSVWIVVILGDVEWNGPGQSADNKFDNISIALTADTEETLGSLTLSLDEPLPLGVDR